MKQVLYFLLAHMPLGSNLPLFSYGRDKLINLIKSGETRTHGIKFPVFKGGMSFSAIYGVD